MRTSSSSSPFGGVMISPVISMPGVQAGWALTAVIGTMLIAIAAAACETLKVFIPDEKPLIGAIKYHDIFAATGKPLVFPISPAN